MAITTSDSIGDVVDTVIAEARRTQMHRTVMEPLVRTYRVPRGAGDRLEIPKFGTVAAGALTEGVDMTNPQTLTTSKVSITPAEVGAQIVLTDRALRTAKEDMARAAGRVLGDAIARKLDKDLLGLLDGFSASLGAAGQNISMGHLRAAVSRLHGAAEPAPQPFHAVLHPYQAHDLAADISPTGTYPVPAGISQTVLENHWVARAFGVDVFQAGNLTVDASDDAKGAVFSKEALVLVMFKDWAVERERDASLRAWELNVVADYGLGEYADAWGVEMYFDASTPSS